MRKRKGPVALVLFALAADVGYVLWKMVKTIRKGDKKNESNDAFADKRKD